MRPHEPAQVFNKVPEEYETAFHWINVGVSADKDSRQNPLNMIKKNYNEDDLVIMKLDIDTPAIELPIAKQLTEDPVLANLLDQFYFEHHVRQAELAPYWGRGPSMNETVADSLHWFYKMRQLGIPAHFWV